LPLDILRSILRSHHDKVENLANLHKTAQGLDPLFYAHFAVWYQQKGEVKDHKHLFIAGLLTSPEPLTEFRSVGRALFIALPVHKRKKTLHRDWLIFIGAIAKSWELTRLSSSFASEADTMAWSES